MMEANDNTLLPVDSAIKRFGIKDEHKPFLERIFQKGCISTSEVLKFVPQSAFQNPEKLKRFVAELKEFLSWLGISIKGSNGQFHDDPDNNGVCVSDVPPGNNGANSFDYWPDGISRSCYDKIRNPKRIDQAKIVEEAKPERIESAFKIFREYNAEAFVRKDIELSLYLREIKDIPLLSDDETRALSGRTRSGDLLARNMLVVHNLRLVVMYAKKYVGKCRVMDLSDLIQSGNEGLFKAAHRYDPELGFKFSTYAGWWIKQSITREIQNQWGIMRVPIHQHNNIRLIKAVVRDYEKKFSCSPTLGEIAAATDQTLGSTFLALEQMSMSIVELDYASGDSDKQGLHEAVPDRRRPNPHDYLLMKDELEVFHALVVQILDTIPRNPNPRRNRNIFRLRYGLDGTGEPKTLDEIGKQYGLTRERVRQICQSIWKRAYRKLTLKKEIDFDRVEDWFVWRLEKVRQSEDLTACDSSSLYHLEPEF